MTCGGGPDDPQDLEFRRGCTGRDVDAALAVFDAAWGAGTPWRRRRSQLEASFRADPGLLAMACAGEEVVGCVASDGVDVITVVAVRDSWRGRGVGRRLLQETEGLLAARGADRVTLGSVDEALAFYRRCGYTGRWLIQVDPRIADPSAVIEMLVDGVLAGHTVRLSCWEGHPQLWLDEPGDPALRRRVESVSGVVVQAVMQKTFALGTG
ncbi:ribosomal protein S18 acetylase RimI-like enzyme [Friedmanniella endophytica]|uniref:Ribosomal protein S18 acetylase RimI-like enzyme n=1 Tax=Microlunatus kandeliicorticis TaxID=1759536 RepID=A0A7W3P7E6_9ACTN|nr:GNAT family N-acetyltransferase [Microlunatus kandeliicorticis]MBA8795943.1 ribosomal protein S18 acetylase RimI-like enzyme [Microlunatus kandeliicorticis]